MTDTTLTLAISPREMAAALRMSEKSLWTLTQAGTIPHVKLGRLTRYPVAAVQAALERMAAAGPMEGGTA